MIHTIAIVLTASTIMWTLDAKSLMKTGQLQGNSKILKNIHKVKRGVHGGPWDNPQFQDGDVNNAARWTGPLYAHAHVDEEMWTGPLTSDVINEEGVINNDGLVHEQRHKRGTERKGITHFTSRLRGARIGERRLLSPRGGTSGSRSPPWGGRRQATRKSRLRTPGLVRWPCLGRARRGAPWVWRSRLLLGLHIAGPHTDIISPTRKHHPLYTAPQWRRLMAEGGRRPGLAPCGAAVSFTGVRGLDSS